MSDEQDDIAPGSSRQNLQKSCQFQSVIWAQVPTSALQSLQLSMFRPRLCNETINDATCLFIQSSTNSPPSKSGDDSILKPRVRRRRQRGARTFRFLGSLQSLFSFDPNQRAATQQVLAILVSSPAESPGKHRKVQGRSFPSSFGPQQIFPWRVLIFSTLYMMHHTSANSCSSELVFFADYFAARRVET